MKTTSKKRIAIISIVLAMVYVIFTWGYHAGDEESNNHKVNFQSYNSK